MRPLYRAGQRDTCTVRSQPVTWSIYEMFKACVLITNIVFFNYNGTLNSDFRILPQESRGTVVEWSERLDYGAESRRKA